MLYHDMKSHKNNVLNFEIRCLGFTIFRTDFKIFKNVRKSRFFITETEQNLITLPNLGGAGCRKIVLIFSPRVM